MQFPLSTLQTVNRPFPQKCLITMVFLKLDHYLKILTRIKRRSAVRQPIIRIYSKILRFLFKKFSTNQCFDYTCVRPSTRTGALSPTSHSSDAHDFLQSMVTQNPSLEFTSPHLPKKQNLTCDRCPFTPFKGIPLAFCMTSCQCPA